jgi:Putative zinc-finger
MSNYLLSKSNLVSNQEIRFYSKRSEVKARIRFLKQMDNNQAKNTEVNNLDVISYSCKGIEDNVDDYLDGDLSIYSRAAFERHVCECCKCTRMLEETKIITSVAASLANKPMPVGSSSRLRARLTEELGIAFKEQNLSLVK